MSSVAVLTQESFNEHRSGLLPEQSGGEYLGFLSCVWCVKCNHNHKWTHLFSFCVQLLGQEPVLERMRKPFPPTRMPSHLCLRRRPHLRGPRKLPTPGHPRSVLSSLLLSPRYNVFKVTTTCELKEKVTELSLSVCDGFLPVGVVG